MKNADPTFRYLTVGVAGLLGLLLATWLMLRPGSLTLLGLASQATPLADVPEPTWEEQLSAVRKGEADRIEVSRPAIGDPELRQLSGLEGLHELMIERGNKITSEGLGSLSKLTELEHLRLRGVRVSDEDVKGICAITSLKRLNLPQADLTNDGLKSVAGLPRLELLRMGSPRVTDDGIAHLATMKNLRWLHLIDIPLGDAALKSIAEIPNLESLYLDGVRISDAGYEQLFRVRPDLHIHVDQHHHDRDPQRAGHHH